jgi:hypothetical protein
MSAFLRRPRPGHVLVATVVVAALISVAAVVDHELKSREMQKWYKEAWFCNNRGLYCDSPKPDDIEAAWRKRELGYWSGLAAIVLLGGTTYVLVRRRAPQHRDSSRAAH